MKITPAILAEALTNARQGLVGRLHPAGYWEGHLASSALATAVAIQALAQVDSDVHRDAIARGRRWLCDHVNSDGGWGDTPSSPSNLSTSLLCWSALALRQEVADMSSVHACSAVQKWLERVTGGNVEPMQINRAVLAAYGDDRTFSAPILTACALSGRLGDDGNAWSAVPQLPFELALCPHWLFRWLRLSVVSYAIPALVAIGLVRHRRGPRTGLLRWHLRRLATNRVLQTLSRVQPQNGGFLEAIPLTSFVIMSLAAAGHRDHHVISQGVRFLRASQRQDGSWPIDTGLATWVTTLAVKALGNAEAVAQHLPSQARLAIRQWLLEQQHRVRHAYTNAAPGGWAWTDLPGGVPDADDTAGALLALKRLGPVDVRTLAAATCGLRWLLGLQNRDGGIPTFCRGWGQLAFDRSCPDITAHALQAFAEWSEHVAPALRQRLEHAAARAWRYLQNAQRQDGAWTPLWFGNQWTPDRQNPTYGTATVLNALQGLPATPDTNAAVVLDRGAQWLLSAQNPDGGWGGSQGTSSTVEETALAVTALAAADRMESACRGAAWLIEHTSACRQMTPAPIGLYFASLWYSEQMYPLVFSVAALDAVQRRT